MRFTLLAVFIFLSVSYQAIAQNFKNEIGLKDDNDVYLWNGQDRYYTNGLSFYFRHALDSARIKKDIEKIQYEISIGQKMYNPHSGNRPEPSQQSRPFAGYLYGSAGATIATKNENIFKANLELGVIGPSAGGEVAQAALHKVTGLYKPQGWDYQIRNTVAINLSAQYTKRLLRSNNQRTDVSLDSYAALGTTFTGASFGILGRLGQMNQLFNSAITNLVTGRSKTKKITNQEFFGYLKPQINYIGYDATISGSLFNHNSPITYRTVPFVFEQRIGFNYSTPRFTADYYFVFKTKEIKSDAAAHQYGAISLYYRFN